MTLVDRNKVFKIQGLCLHQKCVISFETPSNCTFQQCVFVENKKRNQRILLDSFRRLVSFLNISSSYIF